MTVIELTEVGALAPHVQSGSRDVVVLVHNGKTVGAVLPGDEAEVESMLLSINPQFQAMLERSHQRVKTEGGFSSDEVRRRLGLSH